MATAERRARLAPIGVEALRPGATAFARLHIEGEPVPLVPGDRFIVRGFARTEMGGATLGGGVILDVAPPHRRLSDPALLRDLEALARREPVTDVRVRIDRSGYSGVLRDSLRRETGLEEDALDATLETLRVQGAALGTPAGRWLSGSASSELEERLIAAL